MKTYISGRISGLDYTEVERKFENAEDLITGIGLVPVSPLKNGLDRNTTWENHMLKDIEILLTCDAILMLEDWAESRGARIEKTIAEESGKLILFESNIADNDKRLREIKDAIQYVTGLRFEDYTQKGRQKDSFFARMILINYCCTIDMSLPEIANIVRRDRTTVVHCVKIYPDELKYNSQFRDIVRKVDNFMSKSVSE